MAKSQKRSNREVRKPKAEKLKSNVSQPTLKPGGLRPLESARDK